MAGLRKDGRSGFGLINRIRTSRSTHLSRSIERLEERAMLSTGSIRAETLALHNVKPAAMVFSLQASAPAGRVRPSRPGASAASGLLRVTVQRDIVYNVNGRQPVKLDLYRPAGPKPAGGWPVVVAFPGGGWQWASKKEYGTHVSELAKYGFAVAVADYTYSSGARGSRVWPANFEDARAAVQWVRRNADRLGLNPGKVAAEGVSSGSYLANMLGTYPDGPISAETLPADPMGTGTFSNVSSRVQAVVDFYGPTDLPALYRDAPRVRPSLESFLGGTPDKFPDRYQAASPINFVSPDDPPFLIMQGSADQAVPLTQSLELISALQQAGVPNREVVFGGIGHGFEFRIGKTSIVPFVVTFLDEALNGKPITTGMTTFV
jgi:acetyl esterase/lipase